MARWMIAVMVVAVACGCSLFKAKKAEGDAAGTEKAAAEKAAPAEKKAAEKAEPAKKAAPAEKKAAEAPKAPEPKAPAPEPKAPEPAKVERKPAPPVLTTGTLALTVNVKMADVFIDGVTFGQIKKAGKEQDFVVAGGKHELVVKKFGYEDFKANIGLEGGGVNTLEVDLKRVPARPVSVTVPEPTK